MTWKRCEIRAARRAALYPVLDRLGYHTEPARDGNLRIVDLPGRCLVKAHYWVWDRTTGDETCTADDDAVDAGNAIDFLVRVHGITFNDAMRLLSDTASHVRLLSDTPAHVNERPRKGQHP